MSFIRRNSLGLGVVVVKLGRDGTAWADEGVRPRKLRGRGRPRDT